MFDGVGAPGSTLIVALLVSVIWGSDSPLAGQDQNGEDAYAPLRVETGLAPEDMQHFSTSTSCTPTKPLLRFDGGYEVSMCYTTPAGETGQAKSGIWASGESGLLWFFNRDNAEVLVKVLNGCAHNGYRWVFVAPVTDLELELWITATNGRRWTYMNRRGVTAQAAIDTSAFPCADESGEEDEEDEEDDGGEAAAVPDLVVENVSVSHSRLLTNETFSFQATVRNRGDGPSPTSTLRYYSSTDPSIDISDYEFFSEPVVALEAAGRDSKTLDLAAPPDAGTLYLGACVDPVFGETDSRNNCSASVRVEVSPSPSPPPPTSLTGTWTGTVIGRLSGTGSATATVVQSGSSVSGIWSVIYPSTFNLGILNGTVSGSAVSITLYPSIPTACLQSVTATLSGSTLTGTWATVNCTVSESGSLRLTKTSP